MQPYTIRPNFKKIFIVNATKVTLAIATVIFLVVFFKNEIGFDVFTDVLQGLELGIEFDPTQIIYFLVGGVVLVYIGLLVFNYMLLQNIRYELLQDKLISYVTAFFILLDSKEIHYKNIARISFDTDGLINGLLNTGHITLELSAMNEKTFTIEYVDNPEQVAQYLQQLIRYFNSNEYAQQGANIRVGNILEEGGL
ncbi:MAG: hypothetical protein QF824_00165 [Candidatus Woesearchaeota archaeon]|jgi:hypothetical protein|nr:hypothetical protein [Candidatus Woesearchaeota archaeon]|tara:strand:- start:75 stop:662 length:588 start_codon:yes stop_codon:yes gene_type:complete